MLSAPFKKLLSTLTLVALPLLAFAQASTDVLEPPHEFDPTRWDWHTLLYITLSLIVVLVIARAFDVGKLTEKITGRKVVSWNKVNAWAAIIFLILSAIGVWYEMVYHGKWVMLNDSSSEHGQALDSMFTWTLWFTFIVFVITEFLLLWFMWKYQHRPGQKALYYFHNNKLELIWTVVPAIVLTILVLRGFNTWTRITSDKENAEEVEIFAYQFGWKARYAGANDSFGNANFTLISPSNPLGVAINDQTDSLVFALENDLKGLELLIKTAPDSARAWAGILDKFTMAAAYPDAYKTMKEKADDAGSGAYVRDLERQVKRKKVNLERIAEYRKNKSYFNNSGNDDHVTSEIVLIKNRKYLFKFRARDVIHSAWMPEFRAQMNCVPGMSTEFPFTPIKTTVEARKEKGKKDFEFWLYCNKICGAAHYNMKIKITVVENEAAFKVWLAQQPTIVPAKTLAPVPMEKGADSTAPKPVAILKIK